MLKIKKCISIFLVALLVFPSLLLMTPASKVEAAGITYYVSVSSGNDSNNGTSTSTAWKTLSKVNTVTFSAGDRILLKCGDTWTGETLIPKGDGTSASLIEIGTYGTGNKPVISNPASLTDADLDYPYAPDARTTVKVGINIKNYYGWKINGIRIQDAEYGLVVQNKSRPRNAGIWIENCEFNNILSIVSKSNWKLP